jgi:regulator of RNase E activity RraA
MASPGPAPDAQLQALAGLATSTVSDALDRFAIQGQCLGIKPLSGGFRLAGRAWTVQYEPVGEVSGTVGEYIDELAPGHVAVLANGGRLDATVWGELMTAAAHHRSIAGTVIDGVCRDSESCLELGYPIFSLGATMRTGKDRVRMVATEVPVVIAGVRVDPGDLILGDRDGVVAVPAARADQVLAAAREIAQAEAAIRAAVEAGQPLKEARASAGYHGLQSQSAGR